MELIVAVVNAVVVGAVGVVLAWLAKGRFEAIDKRFDAQDQRIDRLEERFETRLESRFNQLQASIDALRSDLTRVALAVGVQDNASNA